MSTGTNAELRIAMNDSKQKRQIVEPLLLTVVREQDGAATVVVVHPARRGVPHGAIEVMA